MTSRGEFSDSKMEGISDKEAEAERCGEHGASGPTDERIAQLAVDSLRYARERDYCGPDYGDGMSSRLLDALPG